MTITNIQQLSSLSTLMLASYTRDFSDDLQGSLVNPDNGANFTQTQAEIFDKKYKYIDNMPRAIALEMHIPKKSGQLHKF